MSTELLEHIAHCDYSVRTNPDAQLGKRRDYSAYPDCMATECETVPFVTCATCHARFDTDARRCCPCGFVFYRSINTMVLWSSLHRKYYCLGGCRK